MTDRTGFMKLRNGILLLAIGLLAGCQFFEKPKFKKQPRVRNNLVLFVSNYSPVVRSVDIRIWVGSNLVVDQQFPYAEPRERLRMEVSLTPGSYDLEVVTKKGEATHQSTFRIGKKKTWAVVNYRHSPEEGISKQFSVTVTDFGEPKFAEKR